MKILKQSISIGFLFLVMMSSGQKKQWTLQECVDYAIENNISVRKIENNKHIKEQNIIAAKGQFFPSLGTNAVHNTSFGDEEIFVGQYVNRTSNSTNFGLGIQQTIFNGFRLTNTYKQSKLSVETSQLELDRIKDDISLNVVNGYLNVLFNKERVGVAKAQVEFSKKQLQQVQELVDAGAQPKANIYDADATLSLDEQQLIIAENSFNLALLSLSQLLQVPYNDFDVQIIEVDLPASTLLYKDIQPVLEYAFLHRSEIKVAQNNIEIAQLDSQISKSGYYPTFTGGYSFGTSAFFSNLSDDEQGFWEQLDNQKSHGLRLSLNIPIFSRLENRTNVAKSKIQITNRELDLTQTKLDLEAVIQSAFTDAQAAFKAYEASSKSLVSQELALANSKERFDLGIITSFDLEQVRIKYVNAQSSLINAKYDFVFKTKVLDFYMGKPITD